MIARDAVPIAHTPPLRRIDIGQVIEPNPFPTVVAGPQSADGDRIMDLVRQTATGTNPPAAAAVLDQIDRAVVRVAIEAPEDFDLRPGAVNRLPDAGLVRDVDTSGWDAA